MRGDVEVKNLTRSQQESTPKVSKVPKDNCKVRIGNSQDRRVAAEQSSVPPAHRRKFLLVLLTLHMAVTISPCVAVAQLQPPSYEECRLDSIFPSGACRGTTVKVEFKGFGSGLTGPLRIVIDGPAGVTVQELKSVNGGTLEASLEIAADAVPGRRWMRVLNERSGLTNFAQFVVGSLPEQLEIEPNNDIANAQSVTLPVVINGRVNPQADLDLYKFSGHAGQKWIAAIAAHSLDVHGQYKNYGIADFSMELLDATGRTLAAAEDTVGFDPILDLKLPADDDYYVRVQLLNFGGFPEAVYRLTLGDVPYAVSAFPGGYQRGTEPSIELIGPGVPARTLVTPGQSPHGLAGTIDSAGRAHSLEGYDPAYPLRYLTLTQARTSGLDVPVIVGDLPEILETEPNNDRTSAVLLNWPATVNGRFLQPNDADWFRIRMETNQKVWVETVAQRFIRSPIDTLLQVYDASGKLLAENDDESFDPGYECYHDYKTTDSKLLFTAPAAGEYDIRVSEQNGAGSPYAIYRLTIHEARPDFRVTHFPDAVPIWGPGTTACVMARVDRFAECQDDIEVEVLGLPEGWVTQSATSLGRTPQRYYNHYQNKVFLTITAPADAAIGTTMPFRIVGRIRAKEDADQSAGASASNPAAAADVAVTPAVSATSAVRADLPAVVTHERASLPLNLFYSSDTGFFRASPVSRVAVAKPQGPWLQAITRDCTLSPGGATTLQVKVHGAEGIQEMPVVVSLATNGVACGLTTLQNLPVKDGIVIVPLKLPAEMPLGTFGITVAQTWRNDIRIGMPGPCTELINLSVIPAK